MAWPKRARPSRLGWSKRGLRRRIVVVRAPAAVVRYPILALSSIKGPIAAPLTWLVFRAVITMDNTTAAEDYVDDSIRWGTRIDLTNYKQVRMNFRMWQDSVTGATINVKYSTTNPSTTYVGGNWNEVCTSSLATEMSGGRIMQTTPWRNLAAGAKADVYLSAVTVGGDGIDDPAMAVLEVQFR